jgi:glycosyltransferase involved in cell wall biosynthesis
MNVLAPIVIFTYNRPNHTQHTVESLLKNPLAKISDLIIFSDAAPTPSQRQSVDEVRSYLSELSGFRSIKVIHRDKNFGLAESIIQGVTEVLQESEKVIVLEDDMVVSPHFLEYMNEALEQFVDDDRVISVHGYVYPVDIELPEAFFLPGADCWGWATWRGGWALFNNNGQYLLDELVRRHLIQEFDYNGAYPYSKMLKAQIKGANDSWAIRWHASAFLAGKLTLYPGRSLVHNIGTDSSGTHCEDSDSMDAKLSETKINLNNFAVESSRTARGAFENFFRQSQKRLLHRLLGKAVCLFRKK